MEAENKSIGGHGYVWSDEGAKLKELAGGVSRIESWRSTRSYFSFKQVRHLILLYELAFRKYDLDTEACAWTI
jgi:hypothetical protein